MKLIDKIEHYRKGRDVYVVGVTQCREINPYQCYHPGDHGRPERHHNVTRFPDQILDKIEIPLMMVLISTIRQELFIVTRWLTT